MLPERHFLRSSILTIPGHPLLLRHPYHKKSIRSPSPFVCLQRRSAAAHSVKKRLCLWHILPL